MRLHSHVAACILASAVGSLHGSFGTGRIAGAGCGENLKARIWNCSLIEFKHDHCSVGRPVEVVTEEGPSVYSRRSFRLRRQIRRHADGVRHLPYFGKRTKKLVLRIPVFQRRIPTRNHAGTCQRHTRQRLQRCIRAGSCRRGTVTFFFSFCEIWHEFEHQTRSHVRPIAPIQVMTVNVDMGNGVHVTDFHLDTTSGFYAMRDVPESFKSGLRPGNRGMYASYENADTSSGSEVRGQPRMGHPTSLRTSRARALASSTGVATVLVVRTIASDSAVSSSAADIASNVFG